MLSVRPPEAEVSRRLALREQAATANPAAGRILQVLIAVFFPVILLAGSIRLLTTPLFLWIEYHRPGFPADEFGFSTEDRMTYGSHTMDYLLNWAGPRYLGELVGPGGQQLFLESEVEHMRDVKWVLALSFVGAAVLVVVCIIAGLYLLRHWPGALRRALFAGSTATLVLAGALAVFAAVAWESFFAAMHGLFFAQGTWTFRVDDTLIRLFPAQFWIDAGIAVGALVLITAAAVLILTRPRRRRQAS